MKIGTRSVLFGAHQFLIHPLFVAAAWWKLYGFPRDPRLWVAFVVHDLGYFGKPNMDGPEGEYHPFLGARIMSRLFDHGKGYVVIDCVADRFYQIGPWGDLVMCHSRFLSRKMQRPFSRLCVADKLATCLEPWWLYLPRVVLTREIREYMKLRGNGAKYAGEPNTSEENAALAKGTRRDWHRAMTSYCRRWVEEHKDGRADTWTPLRDEAHHG
jgi:hypothetical protein